MTFKFNLIDNWRSVLKHAYSVRFLIVAVVFSALDAVSGFMQDFFGLSPVVAATIIALLNAAALASRFMVQPKISNSDEESN